MAVPKRRTSRARKLKRRSHWKLQRPSMSTCSECHSPRIPHRVCANCGNYAGRPVVSTTTE